MWTCPTCGRLLQKTGQPHSCKKVPIDSHFKNKEKAKELFSFLLQEVEDKVGKCNVISLPCCIHLFGKYDFLAVLPKRQGIEIRFALNRELDTPRLKVSVPISRKSFKHCFDIKDVREINSEVINWLKQSYHLKD